MSKTLKKTLSIIVAILMIVTTVPMAFAAEETPDFSDAKVLSTDADGYLYIDGEKISVVYNTFNEPIQNIPGGKYILGGDMNSSGAYAHTLSDAVSINLNGYTWDFGKKYLSLYGAVSIYDTSIGETGKMTSSFQRTIDLRDGSELNLYSGTVENNSENDYSYSLQALKGTANLYGGKLKSNKYAIDCNLRNPEIINLVGTVLESGEGYGQLRTPVTLYDDEIPEIVVDVSDYNGIDLTLQLDFYGYTDYVGKYILIKGVENAEEAEKYKIKINYPEDQPDVYVEEIGYDEATGEIYLYTATNAFTKQPSVENDYTVDFNNPDVSFQWCEVEEKNLGVYTAEEFSTLFTYEFKAGDILKVSTDSEIDFVVLEVGDEYLELENDSKTAMIKIDADETIEIFSSIIYSENSVDIEFSVIKETALEGETEKTLQKVECGKSYYCKATVGENVYISDTVNILPVEHDLIQVDAKAPTCTEIGWEAYEYCTACDYTTYEELPKEIFHKDADKNNKCDDCSAELAFEINRNGELLYYDNPYIQGFQALYDAAQDGDVITLLRDVFAYTIEIRKELTYDLNGFNIITASSRSINIYDNVTIRDSVGGGEIYLAVYIGAPCTIEGGIFNSLGVASGITLDSILSPCAGYYDYKGNAIDTTGKTSIDYAYVIENHTEGDIYNCLGYKCAVCEKYYGEPNPDGHEYTEGVCDLCGYDCPHTETYETVTKLEHFSAQNPDGTWTKATVGVVCWKCYEILEEKEADRADYTEFDEIMAKICDYLDSGKLIDNAYNSYSSTINNIKNNPYIIGSPFQSTPDGYVESLNYMLNEIEAGIADGTMIKADFTYMTSLFDEINALIDNDPNKLIPSESGRFQGIYYGYYMSCKNNGNHSQFDYDQNMAGNNWEGQIEDILAGVKDGTALKADYTEIDEAVTTLEKVKLTDEAKAELKELKAQLTEMKNNPLSSKADVEELMKAVEDLEKAVEDGTVVIVEGSVILEAYDAERSSIIYEKYGKEAVDRIVLIMFENEHEELVELYAYADTITGTLAENADKIEELKRKMDALYDAIERCVIGTHTCEECEITSPAKCEVNAVESGVCCYCNETIEREVENTALTHSFTKYEVVDASTCTVEGKAVALCDNGCNETDEKAVEVIAHSFTEYTYNEDATCTADGTKTAACDYGCGETDTIKAEGTIIAHADEDGDKLCDVCQAEIADEAPEDQVSTYINIVVTLINLILSLLQSFGLIA